MKRQDKFKEAESLVNKINASDVVNKLFYMNKDELIKKAMSELGKRSAKKNKRDYSAMGKKGAEKRWKKILAS